MTERDYARIARIAEAVDRSVEEVLGEVQLFAFGQGWSFGDALGYLEYHCSGLFDLEDQAKSWIRLAS